MPNDFELETYKFIFDGLLKWKVVPLGILKEISDYTGTMGSFYRVINRLEKRKYIKTIPYSGRSRLVYPTQELLRKIANNSSLGIYDDCLFHDGIVTIICDQFSKWETIKEIKLPHEYRKISLDRNVLEPDAVIFCEKDGDKFKVALEIELSRKSKDRVKNKFIQYVDSIFYDCAIYLLNNKSDFEAYQRMLCELTGAENTKVRNQQILDKIILAFKDDLTGKNGRLYEANVLWKAERTSFNDIFGMREQALIPCEITEGSATNNFVQSATARNYSSKKLTQTDLPLPTLLKEGGQFE